ncbi:MAG: hypothetical protein LC708_01775, partial [Actinobacteria bacterium]|nr:hypothetical protein [Actinomycetota bacterium]
QVGNYTTAPSGTRMVLWRKTAAGGETSATVVFDGMLYAKAVMAAVYRGVDPASPLEPVSVATPQAATAVTVASVNASLANERLVMAEAETGNLTPHSWTQPSGMTQVSAEDGQLRVSAALGDQALSAAGPTGTRTASTAGATDKVGVLLALKPAVTNYGYDDRGNRSAIALPAGPATSLGYDRANRLSTYGTAGAYAYRGDGLRLAKTVDPNSASPVTHAFGWDEAGALPQLISDVASDGSTSYYLYGPGDTPLAQIKPRPTINQMASGHAGNTTGATITATWNTPAKAADQILVTATMAASGAVTTPPAGYAQVGNYTTAPSGTRMVLWRKTAAGGETSATVVFDGMLYAKA